jgi:hypothetical protein
VGVVGGLLVCFLIDLWCGYCFVLIVGDVIWIRAARTIRPGEELTYDYMTDGEGQIRCRCSPGCQRLL